MKIGIACGGTGGHVFPGLATAEVLRERGHTVVLWLGGKEIEKKTLAGWDGPVVTVKTAGFPARLDLKFFKALWLLWRGFGQCKREMRRRPPDVLLAMGGYASAAPVLAARQLSVPVVLHEANVIPGRANRFLSRWADVFALGFEETRSHIRHPNMVYTGVPLRSMKPAPPAPPAGWNVLKPGVFTILVMGGSGGAQALNRIAGKAMIELQAAGRLFQVIHLAGVENDAALRQAYLESGAPHLVFSFLHDMPAAYARANLAICRAGGSTCAELARYGLPALLVPYPHAASRHQLANANAMQAAGAADVIEEKNLTAGRLADYICALMADPARLQRMQAAALKRADQNAAAALADLVLQTGRNHREKTCIPASQRLIINTGIFPRPAQEQD